MAFCTRCGHPVPDGSPACPTCQAPQAAYPPAPAYPPPPPAYPPQAYPQQGPPAYPQQPAWPQVPQQPAYPPYPPQPAYGAPAHAGTATGRSRWIVAAVVVAAVVFYLFKTGFFNDPRDVVNRFLDGVQELDVEKVVATIHPRQREQYRGMFAFMFQAAKATGRQVQIVDRSMTVVKKEGDKCLIEVKYSLAAPGQTDNQPKQDKVPLEKSDGEWYITEVSL